MSANSTLSAEAINLPKGPATVLLAASDLSMILSEIKATRAELDALREEIAKKGVTINEKLAALTSTEEQDISRLALDIALDRQRLTSLERGSLAPKQRDYAEILRALLKDHGGKMLARDAKKMMHLSDSHFSELLAKMEDVGRKPFHLNKRQNVIFLK